jgi:hypothetical protein
MVGFSRRALASVLPLQQLQHLDLLAEFGQQQPLLLELTQLPALKHLTLRYRDMVLAAEAAAAWVQLPKLRELLLEQDESRNRPTTPDELKTVVQGVALCTGLTKLVLYCNAAEDNGYCNGPGYNPYRGSSSSDEDGELLFDSPVQRQYLYQAMAVCGSLAGLADLQDLSIICGESELEHNDAIALTALIGLTRLHMQAANLGEYGVDNQAACALVSSLTELHDLTFDRCRVDFGDAEFLTGLGMLAQLTQLTLCAEHHMFGLAKEGLMQLTGLGRLQELHVQQGERYSQITEEVLAEFWAAV